jgi:hypothetical protein
MNRANLNAPHPEFDDVGPEWEELLRWIDTDDPEFDGYVWFEASQTIVLSNAGAQRLGEILLGAMARGRRFAQVHICTYYMTANARQYSALLDFLASGQYRLVRLYQGAKWTSRQEMRAVMEHVLTAILANRPNLANQQYPATLELEGVRLTMKTLHLTLQHPRVDFSGCRMETLLLTDHDNQYPVAAAAAAALKNRPEQGIHLSLGYNNNDYFGILQAATAINTNVTSLRLSYNGAIVGRLDFSALIGFIAAQPNGMELTFAIFERSCAAILEHILADVSTQCPGVHSLFISVDNDALSPLIRERFPRLKELGRIVS